MRCRWFNLPASDSLSRLFFSPVFVFPFPSSTLTPRLMRSIISNCFVIPWTIAHQAPLSMEFSRQEYGRGLLLASSWDLPDSVTNLVSPESPALAGRFFAAEPPGETPRDAEAEALKSPQPQHICQTKHMGPSQVCDFRTVFSDTHLSSTQDGKRICTSFLGTGTSPI